MIEYAEEVPGVYSVSLYRARACREIIAGVQDTDCWAPAEVRTWRPDGDYQAEVLPEVRDASILRAGRGEEIYKEFHAKLDGIIKPLVKRLWRAEFSEHGGTQLLRYPPGGHYEAHTDNGLDFGARFFTVVCYLNEDIEGGGTSFPSLGHVVRPARGSAIFFPSKYMHCAEPVRRGEKYVIVSWLLGPPPIKWI